MAQRKNVLLITYYWPPGAGAGVHRWLRFSKYFDRHGVNLTVYCPENAAWPIIDEELNKKVAKELTIVRRKIFEPQTLLGKGSQKGTGFSQDKKPSIVQQLIIWIRGNLFIPDSRLFWIKPSTRFLKKYLREHPEIDTIISSGPPHSLHVIASNLKRKLGLKWIADFRDPWTEIDFYKDLNPGKRADAKQKRLEKRCLTEADEVVTVSDACAEGLEAIAHRKIHVVTNGYEFAEFDATAVELDKDFTLVHLGSMPFARNPLPLWKALKELIAETPAMGDALRIKLVGTVDYQVLESAKAYGLEQHIQTIETVNHSESIAMQRSAQVLLLCANNSGNIKGVLTGKFFEYLGAKRPIVAIGQYGSDLENAMQSTNAGCFEDFEGHEVLKEYLKMAYTQYSTNTLMHQADNLEQFSSGNLAKKIIDLI